MSDMLDRAMPEVQRALFEPEGENKVYLMYRFPENRQKLARLSLEKKLEWYAFQFECDSRAATIELSSKEFESFWKWRVVIPMKLKRFYYRVKNGEIFKHYQHISEIKKKRRGPERI